MEDARRGPEAASEQEGLAPLQTPQEGPEEAEGEGADDPAQEAAPFVGATLAVALIHFGFYVFLTSPFRQSTMYLCVNPEVATWIWSLCRDPGSGCDTVNSTSSRR